MSKEFVFGICADVHQGLWGVDESWRMEKFVSEAKERNADFIIQLGDFCYPDEGRRCVCAPEKRPENIEAALKFPTYADKESIHALYLGFEKPSYHVIGNHDCDNFPKDKFCEIAQVAPSPSTIRAEVTKLISGLVA